MYACPHADTNLRTHRCTDTGANSRTHVVANASPHGRADSCSYSAADIVSDANADCFSNCYADCFSIRSAHAIQVQHPGMPAKIGTISFPGGNPRASFIAARYVPKVAQRIRILGGAGSDEMEISEAR